MVKEGASHATCNNRVKSQFYRRNAVPVCADSHSVSAVAHCLLFAVMHLKFLATGTRIALGITYPISTGSNVLLSTQKG